MTEYEWRSGGLGLMLSLVGVAIVGYFLIREFVTADLMLWAFVLGLVALVAWLAGQVWRAVRGGESRASVPGLAMAAVMVVCGGVGSAPSNGALVVLAAVGVLRFAAARDVPLRMAGLVALVAIAVIALGSLTVVTTPLTLLALVGAVVLGFLGGLNRRQAELAGERRRELAERTMTAREESAKATLLESRQAVARDIHDVLAHSLGGLVIQLDAAEALLESGRTTDAAARLRDARGLAASGLGEARRAVEALREERRESPVTATELRTSLVELVDAHRALGGVIDEVEHGDADGDSPVAETTRELRADAAVAMRRALQEALSNARKHAPGEAVHVVLDWGSTGVVMEVRNRVIGVGDESSTGLAASGGRHGLAGMAERFAALEGAAVSARRCAGDFAVRAEVPWWRP